ncbi:MAG: hypothetical protein SH819_01035 [Cytophagales bacterium]|nr:hypothetical protein [Cytophagales bacterium]
MNPGSKGWLKDYLEFRQGLFQTLAPEGRRAAHPDFSLYHMLQPTGLMYGQPVTSGLYTDTVTWKTKDKLKVMLAESLISSSLLFHDRSITNPEEMSDVMMKTIGRITDFYVHVFPETAISSTTVFGRKKSPVELAEQILEKRIGQIDIRGNFWASFFQNSLLFLDIFIFGQWIHTNADKLVSDFFKYEREELRVSLVRVMAAAAHANHSLEKEEKKLLDYFLQSAQLSTAKRNECREIFAKGVSVEELNLPTNNSWILKKYYLEIAILTLWADKHVEDTEIFFLRRLADVLSFSNEDVENSLLAVDGFVLEHWKELGDLQERRSYEEVSHQFVERMAGVAARHKARLMQEVRSWEELHAILLKARSRELDENEKQSLRGMLVKVLKAIPTFAVVSLPQRFLTLPVLMQIFPKNFIAETLEA